MVSPEGIGNASPLAAPGWESLQAETAIFNARYIEIISDELRQELDKRFMIETDGVKTLAWLVAADDALHSTGY
jgi:hypothetical protein